MKKGHVSKRNTNMSLFFISAMVKFIERIVRKAVKSSIAETCYCHVINDKFNERKRRKV